MRCNKFLFALAVLFMVLPNTAMARTVVSDGALSVTVDDNISCFSHLTLQVHAPSQSYYEGDKIQLQKLVGTARMLLEQDCPSLKTMTVNGDVNGHGVFNGFATKRDRWILRNLEDRESVQSQPAQQATLPVPAKPQNISYNRNGCLVFYQAPGVTVLGPESKDIKNWCEKGTNIESSDNQLVYASLTGDNMDPDRVFIPDIEAFLAWHVMPKMTQICQHPPHIFKLIVSNECRAFAVKDIYQFVVRDGKPVKSSYGHLTDVKKRTTAARRAYIKKMAMNREDLQKLRGPVLYKDKNIEIYAHDFLTTNPVWPRWLKLDLVFTVDPFELKHLLRPDYMASVLLPIVKKYHPSYDCQEEIDVFQFQGGVTDYWAEVRYSFQDHDPACITAKTVRARLKGRSRVAYQMIERREDKRWGGCDKDGPFCDLSAGKYLNAVYRGDMKTIEQIDSGAMSPVGGGSMLKSVADKYMYDFQNVCRGALGAKAISKTFSYTAETIQYETLDGLPAGQVGGGTNSATYRVNPEFAPLMRRIGNHWGGSLTRVAANYMLEDLSVALNGVEQLQKQTRCEGPEINQFEKNLIRLTTQSLNATTSKGKAKR